MSDFQAIGGVSATLHTLLRDRMERPDGVANVSVTVGVPRRPDDPPVVEEARINLFLYRVTENGALQNQEIPQSGTGAAFGHPPLSLNLHYLLTAYGSVAVPDAPAAAPIFDERTSHFLLGSAMRVLHDVPVVTRRLLTVNPPSGVPVLHDSLHDAFEQIKITLEPLSLEDVTKVWTALSLRYRLSAAYAVSVVQIESQRRRSFPRPVGQPPSPIPPLPGSPPTPGPWVYVIPIRTPSISEVRVRHGANLERRFPYAAIGETLIIRGLNLAGADVRVRLGELRIPVANLTDNGELAVAVPDAAIPGAGAIPPEQRLQPGAHAVSVSVADPLVPQSAMISNDAVIMIVPQITVPPLYIALPTRALSITGTRLLNPERSGETIIGRAAVPRTAYGAALTPTLLQVNIPDTLPMHDVRFRLGDLRQPNVVLGPTPQALDIDIGGVAGVTSRDLPSPVSLAALPGLLQTLIRDARPDDPGFAGARVALWPEAAGTGRLLILPGGLTAIVTITSPAGSTLAADLGLIAPAAVEGRGLLSGVIGASPSIQALNPRLTVQIGVPPAHVITFARPASIADVADALQGVIQAIGGPPAYTAARVIPVADRLLVVPGAAVPVTFGAAPGDDLSVSELQLHARYAVRVRVNGAESLDDHFVELPV